MIGYLSVHIFDNKHIGGILIVNEYGIPVEFKYSEPISSTKLQQIIYGNSLEYYLHVEIIAKGLVQKLENKPEAILVQDPTLLFDKNIVLLNLLPQSVSEKREDNEVIINVNTVSLRLTFMEGAKVEESVLNIITEYAGKIDILEPFERIQKALEFVCESQEK
ncbi:MAG: hypothetical protein ACK4MM_01660 [Fervidobacterium sp.]